MTWQFNAEIASTFDSYVRKHIPMYDEIHRMITELSAWFIADNTNVYDIGTARGEVISNLKTAYPDKSSYYIGIDDSSDMVREVSTRFGGVSGVAIAYQDIAAPTFEVLNASLVVSALTLMFIPKQARKEVICKIYEGLNEGGAFIWVEQVIGEDAQIDRMFSSLYSDYKLRQGVSAEEIVSKAQAIRGVLRPNTLYENTKLLYDAGFRSSDVFFRWGNFVGIVAIK